MEDNFQTENDKLWRQLERLSMMYISDSIKADMPEHLELTRKSKDGGYDGKIIVNITENDDIVHTIMMEAKFRTSIKSLPLHDCSKALIIAFNRAVQTLYIVTNVLFSPQACQEIESFEKKINLKVNKVDGQKLKQYAEQKQFNSEGEFTEEFLESIYEADLQELDISIKLNEDNTQNINTKRQNRELLQKQIYKVYINSVLEKSLKIMVSQLKKDVNMFIVQGAAGVGKTVFLNQLQKKLQKKCHEIHIIDLQLCSSPRVLFIKILEALWGCELSTLFISNDSAYVRKELEELIGCLSDGKLDDNILGAVAQAISMDQSALQGHADTYFYYLTEFIYKIIFPYQEKHTFTLAFYNLNKGEIDTLNFLYSLLCKIHTIITTIVEFRVPFFVEADEKKLISATDYYKKVCNITSHCQIIDILPFKDEVEVSMFLKSNGISLSEQQLDIFIKKLGTIPLYLSLGLSFVKKMLDEHKVHTNELTSSQFQHILDVFSGSGNNLLMTIISYYKQDSLIADCFEIATLLDGELSYELLEYLYDKNFEDIADYLVNTSLFEAEIASLIVRHNLIYDSMKKVSSPVRRIRIAEKLRNGLINSRISLKNKQIKMFELSFYAGIYEYVLDNIEDLSRFLLKEHEYYSVIKYNELAEQSLKKILLPQGNDIKLSQILITILFSYTQLHIFESVDMKNDLKKLETIINLNSYDEQYTSIKLWFLWIQWYIDFYSGNIEKSFQTILKGKTIIENGLFDEQLCGQIYWSYGLSHKRLTSLQQGITDFKEGYKRYPNCILLKNAIIVHEAHQFLHTDPLKTYAMCNELVSLIENTDCFYNEVIQARVDVAMAAFYSKNYKKAFYESRKDYDIAQANSISYQEGRAMNIIAACFLINGNMDEGYLHFKKSYNIFKESGNNLFMWRPSFNIGQIYYKLGRINKALEHYRKLLHELTNVTERLQHLSLLNSEMVCLIYIARVLRENGKCKEADTLYRKYRNSCFEYYYKTNEQEFKNALADLHYIHNDFIIILG